MKQEWSSPSWMGNRGIENDPLYWSLSTRNRRALFATGYTTGDDILLYKEHLDMTDPRIEKFIDEKNRRREESRRPQKLGPVKRFLDYVFG